MLRRGFAVVAKKISGWVNVDGRQGPQRKIICDVVDPIDLPVRDRRTTR
ncbi:MAG TPA: hypothetical protein VNZ26_11145 [Vicinamibacterales bacterium]|nr:hypothetical protein [Vicinamibacterales bacterium]